MQRRRTVFLVMVLALGVLLFYLFLRGRKEEMKEDTGTEDILRQNTIGRMLIKDGPEEQDTSFEEKEIFEQEEKKIALTFDDGPHPFYTEQLLDGLKERGVVATFFVTGEHASLHPDVIKRMQEEGHLIGNHTYSHIQLRANNRQEFMKELQLTSSVIEEITGEDTIYVRPPYGSWDKSLEQELNMIPVLWTVDPLDWCTEDVSCVVRRVEEKVDENSIILMHDYYASTVTAALKIVDILQEEGYVFVTVEEILFE